MPIRFTCPTCSLLLECADRDAGMGTRCPKCQAITTVPLATDRYDAEPIQEPARPVLKRASQADPFNFDDRAEPAPASSSRLRTATRPSGNSAAMLGIGLLVVAVGFIAVFLIVKELRDQRNNDFNELLRRHDDLTSRIIDQQNEKAEWERRGADFERKFGTRDDISLQYANDAARRITDLHERRKMLEKRIDEATK